MTTRTATEVYPPGEILREELEARNWTQGDLAEILGRPLTRINEIICGKRAITPETAKGLAAALGTSAELWLNLESAYQLSQVKSADNTVERRARLYALAPVKEMVRRLWIEPSNNIEVLERRVCDFLDISRIAQEPSFWRFAARSSLTGSKPTPAQLAWLFRARRLARAVRVKNKFNDVRLEEALRALRGILHSVEEVRKVPTILADAGIRLVILESLPNTRIDGAVFWLDESSPVIALSLRYDRIDGFWHTLFHELGHIRQRHGLTAHEPLDLDLVGSEAKLFEDKTQIEQSVDRFATENIIPRSELNNFIARVKPLYGTNKIVRFASRLQVHPGVVVGQLQYRKEIPYSHSRKLLVRVRDVITKSALTDGWGNIPVGI
jgi:HTH-type transcriptional regulator / antitoxin HigA